MTNGEHGLELFQLVGGDQLGSINLVLSCLAHGPRGIGPTIRTLLMHSGVSGSIVDARGCLGLANQLGIVDDVAGELNLSHYGRELLALASWPPYNLLTEEQGHLVLGAILQRPEFASLVCSLIRKMQPRSNGALQVIPGSIALSQGELDCLQALQSTHAIHFSSGILVMTQEAHQVIVDMVGPSAAVSELELLEVLERQRLRAIAAEQYVLTLEVQRLSSGGRPDLGKLVERVAARDVAAGYDIRSFELDGSDRYIEVKSATGDNIRFFLSRNECRFLEDNETTAWIYFIPRAHELPHPSRPVVAIPAPMSWIRSNATVEAQEFMVECPMSTVGHIEVTRGVIWIPIGEAKEDD